ncbi:hypothetical protein NBRC116588_15390 [Pyruvatibacter sp. HU-CL02332]
MADIKNPPMPVTMAISASFLGRVMNPVARLIGIENGRDVDNTLWGPWESIARFSRMPKSHQQTIKPRMKGLKPVFQCMAGV